RLQEATLGKLASIHDLWTLTESLYSSLGCLLPLYDHVDLAQGVEVMALLVDSPERRFVEPLLADGTFRKSEYRRRAAHAWDERVIEAWPLFDSKMVLDILPHLDYLTDLGLGPQALQFLERSGEPSLEESASRIATALLDGSTGQLQAHEEEMAECIRRVAA